MTGVPVLDGSNVHALSAMQYALREGTSNDIVKYALPEAYLTETVWQIDGRNLQNLLQLRTHSSALAEFQELANKLYEALPEAHKYLYADYVYRVNPINVMLLLTKNMLALI
jgi:thymidylate synthase (FAD)